MENMAKGTNKLAVRLFRELSKGTEDNVFVSPLSVQMVLALASTGANGETARELKNLLSLPDDLNDIFRAYEDLIKALQDPVLKLANGMFVEATSELKEDFQSKAEKHFKSPAEAMDFIFNGDKSRELINTWVEKQTDNKIKDLFAAGVITKDTRLILVNAIHFKASWEEEFLERSTYEGKFFITNDKTAPVQMMHINENFGLKYDKELNASILELMYKGGNFRMLVILPNKVDGLPCLEEQLENVNLLEKIQNMGKTRVMVSLPKFNLEETMNLNLILKTLGAKTMFDPNEADFSGLSENKLCISEVVQKACVEVSERGTEAAAATYLRAVPYCMPPTFTANHPFLFAIFSSDIPIFIGRYSKPTEKSAVLHAPHFQGQPSFSIHHSQPRGHSDIHRPLF